MRAKTRWKLAAWGLLAAGPCLLQPGQIALGQETPRDLPPPYVTRQSDVEIPFTVKQGTKPDNQPASVRVFVSWDQGKTWHFLDERPAADGRFRFQPKQDGEYWFATQTVDRSGRTDGAQPNKPQLRLVIDTQKPQLLAQATVGPSSDVTLAFSAADPTLQPATLKIEYQDASGTGPWQAVAVSPQTANVAAGQTTGRMLFRPEVPGRVINLRAEVADAAGNVAYFTQRLSLDPPKPKLAATAGPAADPSATRWPASNPYVAGSAPVEDVAVTGAAAAESAPNNQPQEIRNEVGMPNVVQNPYARQDRLVSASPGLNAYGQPAPSSGQGELTPPVEELPPPSTSAQPPPYGSPETGPIETNPVATEQYQPSTPTQPGLPQGADAPRSPVDTAYPPGPTGPIESVPRETQPAESLPPPTSGGYSSPEPAPTYSSPPIERSRPSYEQIPANPTPSPGLEAVDAPPGQRPRLTNQRRFSLEYDVETVGPEGLADVELWGTSDGGRSWMKWGSDPDRKSPFDVEVNNEASYGFRVVIVGKSGLASNAPQPGDTADIWVGIDLTRPAARLTSAAYGQGAAAGKLDIRWEANDSNLTSRPVTLSISERPDGVFTPIAAGLPNSGQYFWEFDPRSPRQIYLRLEVRDDAGNTAVDQLTEPILVEGLQPKGRIRGFNVP